MQNVRTYQLCYASRHHITLCEDCVEEQDNAAPAFPPLGPVTHGLHRGYCQTAKCEAKQRRQDLWRSSH